MTSYEKEYNHRQYLLMLTTIDNIEIQPQLNWRSNQIWNSITGFEGLITVLEGVTVDVRNNFLRHWGVLDEIFAVLMDENRVDLKPEELQVVRSAIQKLRTLVESLIREDT